MRELAKFIASGAYSGYFPWGPGTAGSAVAAGSICLLNWIRIGDQDMDRWILGLILAFTLSGLWAIKFLEKEWGKDPSRVVVDEWIGMWVSFLFIPFSYLNLILSFVLFRIFDIWKPFGIRQVELIPGAKGVILDDIFAGILANLCLQTILWLQ